MRTFQSGKSRSILSVSLGFVQQVVRINKCVDRLSTTV